jgi:transposase
VLTALAFELVIGTPDRFTVGKQIASYVGLVPSEESSGDSIALTFVCIWPKQATVSGF